MPAVAVDVGTVVAVAAVYDMRRDLEWPCSQAWPRVKSEEDDKAVVGASWAAVAPTYEVEPTLTHTVVAAEQ